jgi:hypothetical protein
MSYKHCGASRTTRCARLRRTRAVQLQLIIVRSIQNTARLTIGGLERDTSLYLCELIVVSRVEGLPWRVRRDKDQLFPEVWG